MAQTLELEGKEIPPALNLHIEPKTPIELQDMLASLATIGKRFDSYARHELDDRFVDNPKLFVSSIKPGSIDISLVPDLLDIGKAAAGAVAAVGVNDAVEAVKNFGEGIKKLLQLFSKPVSAQEAEDISIKDCDDAVNIVKPIASAGGVQNFNVNNVAGNQIFIFQLNSSDASKVVENALTHKATLLLPEVEVKRSVALVWQKIDKSLAKTDGAISPDKGRIEEIDRAAKSILFHENMASVKLEIMADPLMQMVYYVDVEIVRIDDKIKAYRVVGYHGKEPL